MANTIKFSVHRNPLKDAEGRDTYQVRQETFYTMHTEDLLAHLRNYNRTKAETVQAAISILQEEIIEQLTDNKRLRLEGLGTFFLKLGFRKQTDEEGNERRPHYTDPADITGDDICIESIGFTPDREFIEMAQQHGVYFENMTGRGIVGHSALYTRQQIEERLRDYFQSHRQLTRRAMQHQFGLTQYMTRRWLNELTEGSHPFLHQQHIGRTTVYTLATD